MATLKDKMGRPLGKKEALGKILNRLCNYWLDFGLMLLSIIGHIPSHLIRQTFYRLAGVKLGRKSTIHAGAKFYQPNNIVIGEDTIIGAGVFLDGRDKIKIGNHVDIASEAMIYNSEHDLDSAEFKARNEEVEVGDYVFIGPRVIILPGVIIGKGAVVAAGAVVTKNVPSMTVVGGVPAKIIGERKTSNLNYKLGRARLFQ